MQAQPQGKMLAVRAPANRVEAILLAGVAIAAVNAPELTVVSGSTDLVDELAASLAQQGIQVSALVTSHAYHSPMMAPVRLPLVEAVAAVPRKPANLTFVSTALARATADQELCDPVYWGQQLMSPVRFADSVAAATQDEDHILLEVGAGQTLTTLSRQTLSRQPGRVIVPCLGAAQAPGSSLENLLAALGKLWAAGAAPDWVQFQAGRRQRIALPTYPFERKRFWVEPAQVDLGAEYTDNDAPSVPSAPDASVSMNVGKSAEAEFACAERLIQHQLTLIAEQIKTLVEGPADKIGG